MVESLESDEVVAQMEGILSQTYPEQVQQLKKPGYVMLKERPCKILEIQISKPSKAGTFRVFLLGRDIITGKKYEDVFRSSEIVDIPIVTTKDYDLVSLESEGAITLMRDDATVKNDLKLSEGESLKDLKDIVKDLIEALDAGSDLIATVISAMGEERIISFRDKKDEADWRYIV